MNMKIELKSNTLPVLGYSDLSKSKFYEQLEKDMQDGNPIFSNTVPELLDEEICAYIIYKDFEKGSISKVYSGRVEFVGIYPDHRAPFACVFFPMKKVDVKDISYCKSCGRPDTVILKTKKL